MIDESPQLPLRDQKTLQEALKAKKMALAEKLSTASEYLKTLGKSNPNLEVAQVKYMCLLAVCQHAGVDINFEIQERILGDLF